MSPPIRFSSALTFHSDLQQRTTFQPGPPKYLEYILQWSGAPNYACRPLAFSQCSAPILRSKPFRTETRSTDARSHMRFLVLCGPVRPKTSCTACSPLDRSKCLGFQFLECFHAQLHSVTCPIRITPVPREHRPKRKPPVAPPAADANLVQVHVDAASRGHDHRRRAVRPCWQNRDFVCFDDFVRIACRITRSWASRAAAAASSNRLCVWPVFAHSDGICVKRNHWQLLPSSCEAPAGFTYSLN